MILPTTISVIIPTYNREKIIEKTLLSFKNQTNAAFEVIIVDDGSSDNTRAVVERLNDNRFKYYWKENGERGAARNYGIQYTQGDFVTFFDSDDIAYPDFIEYAIEIISQNHDVQIFHTGYEFTDEKLNPVAKGFNKTGILNQYIYTSCCYHCLFIQKNILTAIRYEEDRKLSGTEDWQFFLCLATDYNIYGFSKITSSIVQHPQRSMVTATGESTMQRATALDKHLRNNKIFMQKNGDKLAAINAESYSLAALAFALNGRQFKAFKYLILSAKYSLKQIFRRRSLAIAKHSLLTFFKQ